ncbi:hypothetical protein Pint_35181 [Pistacia integerrima]|uniref:Uncharacterized protein n=1 Tax=Pistacia integerrima TaxID=434235 RepID=A0ACC0Y3Z2_9ROSI|nr:hypothetical protein Pint_35181 [Pistacia integerrima]
MAACFRFKRLSYLPFFVPNSALSHSSASEVFTLHRFRRSSQPVTAARWSVGVRGALHFFSLQLLHKFRSSPSPVTAADLPSSRAQLIQQPPSADSAM